MKIAALAVVLAACGGDRTPAPPVAAAPRPVAAACARVVRDGRVHPRSPWIHRLVWQGGDRLAVLVGEGDPSRFADPSGRSAVLVYDLAHAYGPNEAPLHELPLDAVDLALHGEQALVVQRDGVATLDLATGCLRQSDALRPQLDRVNERALAAIDAVHARFFVATGSALLRVDAATMQVTVEVARPSDLGAFAYDPESDVLVARTAGPYALVLDGETLAEVGRLALPAAAAAGPWIRPGRDEVVFAYDLRCTHHARTRGPLRMAGPRCLDPPASLGTRIVRVALGTGGVIATEAFPGAAFASDPTASWSGDGRVLAVADPLDGAVFPVDGAPRPLARPDDFYPLELALDPGGARFAGQAGTFYVQVADTRTGAVTW